MRMQLWDHSLADLVLKGGPIMWPLLLCSIVALALILDRAIAHLRMRVDYPKFVRELAARVTGGELDDARELCNSQRGPIAATAGAYLDTVDLDDDARGSVVAREGALALEGAERRLRGLSTIAHLATLLGLLGTVAGLVGAFHQIELAGGQVQPSDLASGIWEALLTTVFGLTIAIPCLAAFHSLESRADQMARRMGFIVSYLDQWLGKHTARAQSEEAQRGSLPAAVGQD